MAVLMATYGTPKKLMSLNICPVSAFFPPKTIMNMESTGWLLWSSVWSAGRSRVLNVSTISAEAGSYKSAVWPYLAAGLSLLVICTHSPSGLVSV